jgi:TetR/AcrR family transcriptional regulator, tetracycline repressor protein
MSVQAEPNVRRELSRDVILDAAQTLIDREGDRALTFRRLGAELGVDPTAAYRYFPNKDELLLALGDRLLGEAMRALGADSGDDWRATFRRSAHELRNTLVRHPNLAALISVRMTQGVHEAHGIERGLAALVPTGLPMRDIVGIQRAFADTVLAWSAFSASYVSLSAEARQRDAAAWATTYSRLSPEEYPHIHEARPYLDEYDDAFDLAIELLLDGINARIARLQEKP